jgi:hypothetical protein
MNRVSEVLSSLWTALRAHGPYLPYVWAVAIVAWIVSVSFEIWRVNQFGGTVNWVLSAGLGAFILGGLLLTWFTRSRSGRKRSDS